MTRDAEASMAVLGCIGLVALAPLIVLIDGWVLSILWRWFMVPFLHLPEIGVMQAIGIALVIGLTTHQFHPNCQKDPNSKPRVDFWFDFLLPLFKPLMFLASGWLVKVNL